MRLGTSLRSDRGCSGIPGVRCHMRGDDELMQAWVQQVQCTAPNRAAVQRSEETTRSTHLPAARSTGPHQKAPAAVDRQVPGWSRAK